jgi:uncharacterized repeat protein (TIGR04138 family)
MRDWLSRLRQWSSSGPSDSVENPYAPPQPSGPAGGPNVDGRIGYSLAAIYFVLESLERAKRNQSGHVHASRLCQSILDEAAQKFGLNANIKLREFGLSSSEEVGVLVWRLVETGGVRASEEDSIEDFCGLYSLDLPQSSWLLQF